MPKVWPPNIFHAKCGTREVLDRIADKWTVLVVHALAEGTKRYSELEKQIDGISQKMLTDTLRSLERDGLVQRKVYPVTPPRVEYSLTELGDTLSEPLHAICQWAIKHLPEVREARRVHDEPSSSTRATPEPTGAPPPRSSRRHGS